MAVDIGLIYILIGSTLGIASFFKIIHDYRKEQMKWYSGRIESGFERRDDENITIKLEFMLINEGRRDMSIPHAFLKISPDSRFLEFGTICLLQNFKPIFIRGGETKPVTLTFVYHKPSDLKDIQDVKGEEILNHGLNAQLEVMDNERHIVKAQLFIYEGGFIKFFDEHRGTLATSRGLSIIMERAEKEVLRYL